MRGACERRVEICLASAGLQKAKQLYGTRLQRHASVYRDYLQVPGYSHSGLFSSEHV
jgi:hypothetical protein